MDEFPSELNVFVSDIKDCIAAGTAMAAIAILCALTSCTKEQQAQAKTVLEAADKASQIGQAGCILFPALPVGGQQQVEDVCLGVNEVRQIVTDYQRGKAQRLAASAAPVAPPPPVAASASSPAASSPAASASVSPAATAPAASGSAGPAKGR